MTAFALPFGSQRSPYMDQTTQATLPSLNHMRTPHHSGNSFARSFGTLLSCLLSVAVASAHRKRCSSVRKVSVKVLEKAGADTDGVTEINYYKLDVIQAAQIRAKARAMVEAGARSLEEVAAEDPQQRMLVLLSTLQVLELLQAVSRLAVFSHEFGLAFKDCVAQFFELVC
jgi:hypothetical protein